jgi:F0F1-type ATP synthase assembly protein I
MMLWIIAAVLIALWLLGMITSTTIGGFIHVLLVIAVIVILVNLFRGKNKTV